MKPKTIAKTIDAKMTDWMATLPLELRDLIKNKIVVTGGSIASMFLKENVNDYDMYFKDIKCAIAVSQYYCKEWVKENDAKKSDVSKNIQPMLRISFADYYDTLEEGYNYTSKYTFTHKESISYPQKGQVVVHPEDESLEYFLEDKKYWGKALRVEIFVKSAGVLGNNPDEEKEENYQYFEAQPPQSAGKYLDKQMPQITDEKGEYRIVFMSSNAITLSDKVQIVIRFYGNPAEIHDTYDFVHATNYWTRKTGLVTNTRALEALLSKELIYTGSKYPLASIFRTRKFLLREWKCHVGNYVKMAMQLNDMDLCDPYTLEEQLTGVDAAYLHEIIKAVKDKRKDDDTFEFNSAYICELADRLMGEDSQTIEDEIEGE